MSNSGRRAKRLRQNHRFRPSSHFNTLSLRVERLERRLLLDAAAIEARDDTYTLDAGTTLAIPAEFSVLRNDRGHAESSGQAELVEPPQRGNVELEADGSFTYVAAESFDGTDSFSYRVTGDGFSSEPAVVTLGTPDALTDVVRYRFEVLSVDGSPISQARVGEMLELRAYVQYVGPEVDVGVALATLETDQGNSGGIFEQQLFNGDGFFVFGGLSGTEGFSRVAALRPRSVPVATEEAVLFRALFTAAAPGTVSVRALRPAGIDGGLATPWPAATWNQAAGTDELQFVPNGAVDYGDSVQVEFVASDIVPPEVVDDFYVVAPGATIQVDAVAGVLANDAAADSAELTARLVQGPTDGKLTLNPDGSFTYEQTSQAGRSADRFYYLADDGQSARLATVLIRIDPDLAPPPPPSRSPWQNPENRFDVNADSAVDDRDRAELADALELGVRALPEPSDGDSPPPFVDVDGDRSLSFADLAAVEDQLGDDLVELQLEVVDASGSPIDSISIGEPFLLQVFAVDLRTTPEGVFAAFSDVTFDPDVVANDGEIEFAASFQAARSGDFAVAGLADEVGASRNAAPQANNARELVYQIPMIGQAAGQTIFASDPADLLPQHDVLLLGRDTPVPVQRIRYGEATLTVGSATAGIPQTEVDRYSGREDQRLSITAAAGVLANDTEADGLPLTASLVTDAAHGVVSLADDGSFEYTPDADFAGVDQFTYRASNGQFSSIQTKVEISIEGVSDDRPVAEDDHYDTVWNELLTVSLIDGVLSNDRDADGDSMTAQLVGGPAHGSLELAADGSFVYRPEENFLGDDSFTYQASDGERLSDIATVVLRIREQSEAIVRVRLEVVDANGDPIDQVRVGENFRLRAFVEDVRLQPFGVFAAYTDVEYNAGLATALGEIQFGEVYSNGKDGDLSAAGIIDEAGAFASSFEPLGGGEFLLFSVEFAAAKPGKLLFAGNPADEIPGHDFAVYGLDDAVPGDQVDFEDTTVVSIPAAQIAFGRAAISILAINPAQADDYTVRSESRDQLLDVLANDLDETLTIDSVGSGSRGGTARPSTPGGQIVYTPVNGFIGVETLVYHVRDEVGDIHEATVTVHVVSRYQNQLNRYDTDGDGVLAPLDALFGINRLNDRGARKLQSEDLLIAGRTRFLDTNGDGFHSSGDVLAIINRLNQLTVSAGEGESPMGQAAAGAFAGAAAADVPERKESAIAFKSFEAGAPQVWLERASRRLEVDRQRSGGTAVAGPDHFWDETESVIDQLASDLTGSQVNGRPTEGE